MSERGVSDVIGYVLVFSLITASIAVVSLGGLTSLQHARNAEQLENAERAFDVLETNIRDIHARDAPSRLTEIKLNGAQLRTGEPTMMTVEVLNVGSTPTYSTQITPIVYTTRNQRTKLVYSGGMRMRVDGDNAIRQSAPPLLFQVDSDTSPPVRTVAIAYIQTRSPSTQSVGGTTTGFVRADRVLTETMTSMTTPADGSDVDGDGQPEYDVRYTIETTAPQAAVWEAYIEAQLSWKADACTLSGGTVQCEFPVERLFVTATRINVKLNA